MKKERFLVGNLYLPNTKVWVVGPLVIAVANIYLFFWFVIEGEINHLTKAKKNGNLYDIPASFIRRCQD